MGARTTNMGGCCAKMANCCLCAGLGRCGFSCIGQNRKIIVMWLVGAMCIVNIVFQIVGCFGLSDDSTIVKSTQWAKWTATYQSSEADVYMNLEAVRVDYGSTSETAKWDDIDTNAGIFTGSDLGDCKDTADGMKTGQIIGTIALLGALNLAFKRGGDADNGCLKLLSIITQLVSFIASASSHFNFMSNCHNNVPSGIDADYGIGFILPFTGTWITFVGLVIFALCPCPEHKELEENVQKPVDGVQA